MKGSILKVVVAVSLSWTGLGCQPEAGREHANAGQDDARVTAAAAGLTPEQKLRAMRMISVFENGTVELQYAYVEALDDSDLRGYTCGLGFTTGTEDALEVIQAYTKKVPNNPLAQFIPRLRQGRGGLDGLKGYPKAWQLCAKDQAFNQIQEQIQDKNSYNPALAAWRDLGLKSALSLAILYDTAWMHGPGDDADGLLGLIARTTADPSNEPAWLAAFMEVLRADLLDPVDKNTQDEWRKAVHRADALNDLVKAENFDFRGPFHIGYEYDAYVP
jgi:chitosanase